MNPAIGGSRRLEFAPMSDEDCQPPSRRPAEVSPSAATGAIDLVIHPPIEPMPDVFVSVIIPVGPCEVQPDNLLAMLPSTFEILLARGGTRASSMNHAASIATGRNLWFLHADTTLDSDALSALLDRLREPSAALHYFDLRFDGGALMRLTELGVSIRSRLLGIPFGDQAFCIPASVFWALGGYDEMVAYGEDHVLVRSARRAGIPVLPVGATIATSARKYRKNGWLLTTLQHWRRTWLQLRSKS